MEKKEKEKRIKERPLSLEETQANHDAWWESLTEKDKEKLYKEKEECEKNIHLEFMDLKIVE